MKTRPRGLTAESGETFWRSLQTLSLTRMVIASVLLVYLIVGGIAWHGSG